MAPETRPSAGRRTQALLLGLVPGLAHVAILDRTGWGTLFFLLFMAGVDAAVTGRYLLDREWAPDLYQAGWIAAGGVWLASWLDVARLMVFRNYEKRAALRRDLAKEGIREYAAGRLARARKAFRDCLDLDYRDADVLFWYGCVESRRGKFRRARRAFRRCRKYDREDKWAFQVGQEEKRLAEAEAGAGGDSPGG